MSRITRRQAGYTFPNKLKLIRGGRDYFNALQELIHNAKVSVYFQTYIFEDDETGNMIADALKSAAGRGVKVYLILDGYASQSLSSDFIRKLTDSGIQFKFFEPLFRSTRFYFGRRLHHKVIVADDAVSLVGGINITNRYNDIDGRKAWLDFAVLSEGAISAQLAILCWKTWNGFINASPFYKPLQPDFKFDVSGDELCKVRMRRNDWVKNKNQISRSYLEMFRYANKEIIILCSYFLPGFAIRKGIRRAIRRGVSVKIIMAGVSDVHVAKNAERYMYAWLVRHKIDIYEYRENVLHGKVAVCDKEWVTIGSYNINDLSAFASIELNLDISNNTFAEHVHVTLSDILTNHCDHISTDKPYKMNIFRQFISWLSYQFVRSLFYLFTFYYRQEKPGK